MTLLFRLAAGLGVAVLLPFLAVALALALALPIPLSWLLDSSLPILIAAGSEAARGGLAWILVVSFCVLLYMNVLPLGS